MHSTVGRAGRRCPSVSYYHDTLAIFHIVLSDGITVVAALQYVQCIMCSLPIYTYRERVSSLKMLAMDQ